ncbi:hypothetical protein GS399_09195 [Pedobacter sp. HMF7647]|uniref:Uncharacterized protein n=1 Tax=Hufsiella arboris TaxID=2695275 RepID=A0A7K1Y967_9SPHI|nr:hypothetical protein [Hufsiella arboris]MXV51143.1 hypothetical protein [Hufsiella arboris]
MRLKSLFITITIAFSSCSSVQYIGNTYSPTSNVDIFLDRNDIQKSYAVMGKIDGYGIDFTNIQSDIMKEARKRGADAVLLFDMDSERINSTQKTTTNVSNQKTEDSTEKKITTSTTTDDQSLNKLHAEFLKYK